MRRGIRIIEIPFLAMTLTRFVEDLGIPSSYRDRHYPGSDEDFKNDINTSTTLYVGNLSFYTSEEQILSLFGRCGPVKRIILGLDRNNKTPCGFCFVEFFERFDALLSKKFLDGAKLDDRFIRVDIDPGFREGRQFGRGRSGGQVQSFIHACIFLTFWVRSVMKCERTMMLVVVAGEATLMDVIINDFATKLLPHYHSIHNKLFLISVYIQYKYTSSLIRLVSLTLYLRLQSIKRKRGKIYP